MAFLLILLVPLVVAMVLARGDLVRTVSCLGLMGVGCLIACYSLVSLLRTRASQRL